MADALAPIHDPLTIAITRTVKPGQEANFETLVRAFIPTSLTFPGHLGVHVVKPLAGRSYQVWLKFARREQWQAFLDWPPYADFRLAIEPLLEREPCVEELSGLESWFTLPHQPVLHKLPRWKMATLTFLGVFPTSMLLGETVGRWVTAWPVWLNRMLLSACMVMVLTWVVMPLLTQAFARWLYGSLHSPLAPKEGVASEGDKPAHS
ncbi:MAG: antibiotic biosynthesis monooxygenase [Gemmatales bacterium]